MSKRNKSRLLATPYTVIAGVDEAGRGPLAGPVVVAAAILGHDGDWSEVDDSKKLSRRHRERQAHLIRRHAQAWHICFIDPATIDRINVLAATMLGMQRAIAGLSLVPQQILIDGNRLPELTIPALAIVNGDATEKCIGAASILAKTARDEYMCSLHLRYPEYGFDRHKGYPTQRHLAALRRLGPTPEHRRSFAPVRSLGQRGWL